MKTKISFILIISICFSSFSIKAQNNNGFGVKQSQGILKGILLGGALGGIIGNQKSKSVEGALIGGTIGALIGNKTGQKQDFRHNQEKEAAHLERQRAIRNIQREREAAEYEKKSRISHIQSFSNSQTNIDPLNDPEIIAARQRAEKAELELQRYEAARHRQAERARMVSVYQERERLAMQRLFRVR